jgi:hypothetical protein
MAEGLQRALNAASETRRRTAGKPAKPWRVYGDRLSNDYRSQSAAYEEAGRLSRCGVIATVYHWENGSWQRYEVIEPQDTREVQHLDGDPRNNELSNLALTEPKEQDQ